MDTYHQYGNCKRYLSDLTLKAGLPVGLTDLQQLVAPEHTVAAAIGYKNYRRFLKHLNHWLNLSPIPIKFLNAIGYSRSDLDRHFTSDLNNFQVEYLKPRRPKTFILAYRYGSFNRDIPDLDEEEAIRYVQQELKRHPLNHFHKALITYHGLLVIEVDRESVLLNPSTPTLTYTKNQVVFGHVWPPCI